MDVAIAGGGIAGLAAAIALAQRGISVDLFERAGALEEIGAGIQLSPNAMAVLGRLGVTGALAASVTAPRAVEIRAGRSGRRLTRIPLGDTAERRYRFPYCVVHRADLQAALLTVASRHERIAIRLGSPVEDVSSGSGRVRFRVGHDHAEAELLIAADGIDSRIRSVWFGGPQARAAGSTAWRATLAAADIPPDTTRDVVALWLGSGAHCVHYAVSGGTSLNVVVVAGAQSSASPEPPLPAFPVALHPLMRAVGAWRSWPLASVDPDRSWRRECIALIGDAAHAMLPSAAQGGAQALEDAWVLAAALAAYPGRIDAALAAYEGLRRPRVQRIARSAEGALRLYGLRGPAALARDIAIAALPPKLHLARLDPVYGWRPGEINPE